MRKKSGIFSTVILLVIMLVGLSVMLYPSFSDWWNKRVQSRAVAGYQQAVAQLDESETNEMKEKAIAYNEKIASMSSPFADFSLIENEYFNTLDVSGTGIMGFISIPQISVELPIYHGTTPEVLNVAAGHLEGSSFPIGGENVHAVIVAHRGLPSARLFTDLNELVKGDIFTVTVLDEVYTYEVEEILIVLPEEMEKLSIIPGGDYITLMTCTPYGINTHRLLVRSRRVETFLERSVKVDADAFQVDEMVIVPFIAAPLVVILIAFWIFGGKSKVRTKKDYLTIISKLKEAD